MALNQKQKGMRDKKVEEIAIRISEKKQQIERNNLQAKELADKLQAEVDEAELLKQALEGLK